MQLTITTTQNTIIYDERVDQIMLPSENGILTVFKNNLPTVVKLIPWVIEITSAWKPSYRLSISKGIALITIDNVRITVSVATAKPLAKLVELHWNQQLLELKLQKLKTFGSVEQISQLIYDLEKVKADIQLIEHKR